jgi:hypothetical protein
MALLDERRELTGLPRLTRSLGCHQVESPDLTARILMVPPSGMTSQGPSARDLALSGIAVSVPSQPVEDGLQFTE